MKPRPTEAEFDELKRERDEALDKVIDAFADKHGFDRSVVVAHFSPARSACYCGCPDGPCQHIWDGPAIEFDGGRGYSVTCSRCGTAAISHSLRFAP